MKRTSRRPRRNPSPLDNPAFRAWFKDSAVKDWRTQEPLVVFHGASDAAPIFREGFKTSVMRGDSFFATDSFDMALSYANAHRSYDYQHADPGVIPLYLSIQWPMIVDWGGKEWRGTEKLVEKAKKAGHDGVVIRNVLDYYTDNERRGAKPATVYVWFKPTQAKSAATGRLMQRGVGALKEPIAGSGPNVGTFDPDDPSILRNPALPTALYHATPQRNLDSILQRGLLALNCSKTLSGGGVFLADEKSLAQGYAERRFGMDPRDYDKPWVLLKIDPIQLDPSRFEPDPGGEAQLNAEDIEARGYTIETMPWWVSLEETGQMVYAGNVPPGAIEPIEIMLPTKGGGETWEPVRVQRNRRGSRPKRTSRRRR